MVVWKRLFALTSTAALVAAAAAFVGGPGAAAQSSSVSFTSQPTVANLVAHYVVSPTGGPHHAASASTDESPLPPKWPKGHGPASIVGNTGGGNRNHTRSTSPPPATPGTTPSLIRPPGAATTSSYLRPGLQPA